MTSALEWNNSNLTTLQGCGERYRRRVIEREPEPPTPSMIRGTVVHRVAKAALRRKIGRGNDALPTDEEARDLAATWFDGEWGKQEVRLVVGDDEDGATAMAQAKAETKDDAIHLAAYHLTAVASVVRPVAVERKIVVRPKDSDLTIHGTLDVVTEGETVTLEDIRDLKSGKKSPGRDMADKSQQLTVYGLIRWAEKGQMVGALKLDHLYRTPANKTLKHVEQTTTRDAADFAAVVARINTAVEAVKRGVFVPADPSSWWCSEKWCGYWTSCPYVRRTRRPTS